MRDTEGEITTLVLSNCELYELQHQTAEQGVSTCAMVHDCQGGNQPLSDWGESTQQKGTNLVLKAQSKCYDMLFNYRQSTNFPLIMRVYTHGLVWNCQRTNLINIFNSSVTVGAYPGYQQIQQIKHQSNVQNTGYRFPDLT